MKRWWKSKTLWINAALAVGSMLEANFQLLQSKLGPESYLAALGLVVAVNFILRFQTTQSLGKPEDTPK